MGTSPLPRTDERDRLALAFTGTDVSETPLERAMSKPPGRLSKDDNSTLAAVDRND
jgi:hypothetical protein